MAERPSRDPTEALSRASTFPTRAVIERPGTPESEHPASSSAFNGEDFLFHLYRGSELLQDNCVSEAKEELERALRFQPSDAEGQGLLGIVYFRLGMYPRAIGIYEELIKNFPREISPKVNLALCYLKTGQQHQARDVLEEVIEREPEHRRAWGYYGLALERLGDFAKAQTAFERAGQPQLARRMQNRIEAAAIADEPGEAEHQLDEVRLAAADAVQELDAHAPFVSAPEEAGELEPVRSRRWRAVEPGEEVVPRPSRPPSGQHRAVTLTSLGVPAVSEPMELPPPSRRGVTEPPPAAAPPRAAPAPGAPSALVAEVAVGVPDSRERLVLKGTSAVVRVEVGFALRNDALRAVQPDASTFTRGSLRRRARGRTTDEPFGGAATPWTLLEGSGLAVLAAGAGRSVAALELGGEFVYLRESRLLGFDSSARYENGRLPAPPEEPAPIVIVQLSGRGLVLVESERPLRALVVTSERRVIVRSESVAGWTGRMLAQPITAEDAPTHAHGFVSFSGEGAVLLDDA
ncbi:MAG TPA: tetratricopeptide repeat protein [Polyangiaceae bacterium]|nr:tetratricopeptide repeat protein [Polyangiaceae bacterium]